MFPAAPCARLWSSRFACRIFPLGLFAFLRGVSRHRSSPDPTSTRSFSNGARVISWCHQYEEVILRQAFTGFFPFMWFCPYFKYFEYFDTVPTSSSRVLPIKSSANNSSFFNIDVEVLFPRFLQNKNLKPLPPPRGNIYRSSRNPATAILMITQRVVSYFLSVPLMASECFPSTMKLSIFSPT